MAGICTSTPKTFFEKSSVADQHLDAERTGPGPQDVERLGEDALRDEEGVVAFLSRGMKHVHRFRRRGGLVEQRGVGHFEAGEVDHHLLEVEQRLEPALGNLRLVRRIGGVPTGVLEHISEDDGRRDAAGVAHPDEGLENLVPAGNLPELLEQRGLAQRGREVERTAKANRGGNRRLDKGLHRTEPQGVQHAVALPRVRSNVTVDEVLGRLPEKSHGKRHLTAQPDGAQPPWWDGTRTGNVRPISTYRCPLWVAGD